MNIKKIVLGIIVVLAIILSIKESNPLLCCFTTFSALALILIAFVRDYNKNLKARQEQLYALSTEEAMAMIFQLQSNQKKNRKQSRKQIVDQIDDVETVVFTTLDTTVFLKTAKKWRNRIEFPCVAIPFNAYWPTYAAMNKEQEKWYFYWRSQAREGKVVETSLSYIFVHVYELINRIGIKNELDGYSQLYRLWLNYRPMHPKLDQYLPVWLADFAIVHKLDLPPLQSYFEPTAFKELIALYPDLILEAIMQGQIKEFPLLPFIDSLIDYKIYASKFYQPDREQLLETVIDAVLTRIQLYFQKQGGMNLFDRYRPKQTIEIKHNIFSDTIYEGPCPEIVIASVYPYSTHPPLRAFLTSVVKYSENQLRQRYGYRGKLKLSKALDPAICRVIEETVQSVLLPLPTPVEIEIEADSVASNSSSIPIPARPSVPEKKANQPLETPSPSQKIIIDFEQLARLDHDSKAVFEMLAIPEDSAESPSPAPANLQPIADTTPSADFTALEDEGWREFATQLTPIQKELLQLVLNGNDVMRSARKLATIHQTMPSVLFDSINELSQNTIGDILIEGESTPHIIEEAYIDMVTQILGA